MVPPSGKKMKYQPNGGKKHGATSAHTLGTFFADIGNIIYYLINHIICQKII
jgi:hypothetical protein